MTREERERVWESQMVLCRRCENGRARRGDFISHGTRRCAECHTRGDPGNSRRRLAREQSPEGREQKKWTDLRNYRMEKIKERMV